MTREAAPTEFQGRLSAGKDWREIVAWVGDLPPMPQVASKAVQLIENPDTTANELTTLLAKDTALVARVLKIANSAMFSRQREITTLNQAIMMIGFKALKGVIVAASLRQMNKTFGKLDQLVWESSMGTAVAASLISRKLRKKYVEEIFLLGMMHGLGQIVLLSQKATIDDYKKVVQLIETNQVDYVTAEQQVLGFAHPLIGALVAKKWNFNPDTCQVILHYADAIEYLKPESELEEKTAMVQLADLVTHAAGIGAPPGLMISREQIEKVAVYVGFDPVTVKVQIEEVIKETQTQFQNERHVYE
jgi:HD-like signal output (HDOD) protein